MARVEARAVYDAALAAGGSIAATKAEEFPQLQPGAGLKAVSGQDIQRKGTTRKAKFLFSLPGSLASVKGGTIGKISGMNTGTPTMTLHFPQGDILLQGAVVKPATARFMTLQCSKAGIVCEDVFNAVVVFSSAVWQGKDGAATLPPELIQDALPLSTFSAGCGRPRRRATASSQEIPTATQDSQVSSASSARGGRRRRAAAVVTSLAEEDLAEEAGGGSDSDSGDDASVPDSEVEEVVVSRASLLAPAPGAVGGVKRQRLPASSPAPGGISDSEDSSDGVAVVVHSSSDQASQDSDATESGDGRPPPKRRAAPRRGSARAKPAHQGSEERSEAGSDSDSGDSEEASPSSQSSAFDDSDDEDFQDE